MPTFEIGVEPGTHKANGKISARVILSTDGEQRTVETLTLDAPRSVTSTAKRWANDFGIVEAEVLAELRRIGKAVLAAEQAASEKKREEMAAAPRLSGLAERFLREAVVPTWHRGGESFYSGKAGRELKIGKLWTLADDAWFDQVNSTVEGMEVDGDYRVRVAMFQTAITIAAASQIAELPEQQDAASDPTVNADDVTGALVRWLLAQRTFRTDSGVPITTTYFEWAAGVGASDAWSRCHTSHVFARRDGAGFLVAVHREQLVADLRYSSSRALIRDLAEAHLADTKSVKCERRKWNCFQIRNQVLDRIGVEDAK